VKGEDSAASKAAKEEEAKPEAELE